MLSFLLQMIFYKVVNKTVLQTERSMLEGSTCTKDLKLNDTEIRQCGSCMYRVSSLGDLCHEWGSKQ